MRKLLVGAGVRLTIKKESVTVVPSVENKLALRITLILSLYIHTVQRGTLKKKHTQSYEQLRHILH